MDIFLGKITQHAMNYAIRSGIAITGTYVINQCSRVLKTVDDTAVFQELQTLQERLDSKIRIISPAIDMIELISARGNTSLESAVSLTKSLRWDIQSLALRLSKAASSEEASRQSSTHAKTRTHHKAELCSIVEDIRKLLLRIEDAVPLINLAITTSGARLSTVLPASVSPSRLLQASTFLTAGDMQYSIELSNAVQIGPGFTLSVYMLFSGHAHRVHVEEGVRDTTWKEAIHKAKVKLIRVPLVANSRAQSDTSSSCPVKVNNIQGTLLLGETKANEFAYRLEIIEDLDDNRLHSFEDDEPQPGPYKEVQLAGIRELVSIHEISKIFYADTGKILNIGNEGDSNSPVLLLKRDVHALPPRRMMERPEQAQIWHEDLDKVTEDRCEVAEERIERDDSQSEVDNQIRCESISQASVDDNETPKSRGVAFWSFPLDLDPEWLAFEVYTETEDESSEGEQDVNDDSAYASGRPSSSARKASSDSNFIAGLANLRLETPTPSVNSKGEQEILNPTPNSANSKTPASNSSPFAPIRSSLSLLEMLIRLTALQQFQQASHLSIPDELLTFFLEESSTTGAGIDGEERRRKRHEARQKVGFDPYDESPVKRRGEDYQYQSNREHATSRDNSRVVTSYDDYDGGEWLPEPSHSSRDHITPQTSPEPWLIHSRGHSSTPHSRNAMSSDTTFPSSPQSPYVPVLSKRAVRPLDRVQQARCAGVGAKIGSLLGTGMSADTDSSLGISPKTPGQTEPKLVSPSAKGED